MNSSGFYRFGVFLSRRRWPVVAVWAVLIVTGGLLAGRFHDSLSSPAFTTTGSESERAAAILDERFETTFTEQTLLVFKSDALTVDNSAYRTVIESSVAQLSEQEGVAVVISPLAPESAGQISDDRRAAYAVVGLTGAVDDRLDRVEDYAAVAGSQATNQVRVMFTGQSPISHELINVAQQDLQRAETVGLPIALLILVIAFGSLVAAGLPVLTALGGIGITFGILTIVGQFTSFNLLIENVVVMIGLAIGIDYVLFIVTRFREELSNGQSIEAAVGMTVATAGKTVLFSGLTVLISVSGMLIVKSPTFQQIAIGMATVVPVMVILALTLLPASLAILGARVNRLTLPFLRNSIENPDAVTGVWARWSRVVMRRPVVWAVGTTIVLLLLVIPLARISLGVSLDAGATDGPAGQGFETLNERFSAGQLSPIQIVYESEDGALDDADLGAIAAISNSLADHHTVTQVTSVSLVLDQLAGNHSAETLEHAVRNPESAFLLGFLVNTSNGGDVARITVASTVAPDTPEAYDLVDQIRDEIVPAQTNRATTDVHVGGFSAEIVDISDEVTNKLPLVFGFVLGFSFILLMLIFRSLLIPLKAIIMNMLSVGAAYGLLVLVFQDGWGESIFGFESTGMIQVDLPLFTFALLFGLSMDYEVFLLSRVKEEWEKTGNTSEAVAYGLEHTARTITSAAAIMVVVFTAFAFTSMIEVQQIGFALAAAILIDATLIRILLVPATMRLMGRWNWWLSGWLDRRLPRIPLSETAPA
ncbi:MMPL family transporter [soil metagenome]